MASFSAQARRVAYGSPSRASSIDDRSSRRSLSTDRSIFGPPTRSSTGDTGIISHRSTSRSSSKAASPERSQSRHEHHRCCSCHQNQASRGLAEKEMTKHILERRVVSFPPEGQTKQEPERGRQEVQRIRTDEPTERFIRALEQDGRVVVERSTGTGETVEKLFAEIDS